MAGIGKWCLSHWRLTLTGFASLMLSYLAIRFWLHVGVTTSDAGRDFLLVIAVAPFVCAPLELLSLLYMRYSVEGKFFK